jgi:purine-nucleoside phosphorylase
MKETNKLIKKEIWEFNENIDIGIILEQGWMLEEVIKNFKNGELFYCFLIDKDMYILNENGKRYLFLQSNGASIVACRVEEMVKWKAKRIYRIGTCGALQDNISIGDVILSMAAIRDEGTSHHYLPVYFPSVSNPELLVKFKEKLLNFHIPVHIGITWTTDGRFVESNEKILSFSQLGVKAVDMETSAFLTVCWVRKIPAISIGIVTDKPIQDLREEFKGKIHDFSTIKIIVSQLLPKIILAIFNLERETRG